MPDCAAQITVTARSRRVDNTCIWINLPPEKQHTSQRGPGTDQGHLF